MYNGLIKKFLEYGLGSIITLLIGFITSPIITRLISPEQNGKFGIFTTITNLLMLIVMVGLDQSYVRYYYEEDEQDRKLLFIRCLKLPLIFNLIASALLIMFYQSISQYIVNEVSISLVILLCVYLFLSTLSRFILLEIRMKQNAKLYSVLNIILKITNIIFVCLAFFRFGNHYLTLVIGIIFANLFVIAVALFSEKAIFTKKVSTRKLKTSHKELITYGIPLIFSMAVTWIFQSIDKVALKEFSGYAEVGIYNGAMTIIALLNAVQSTFTTFWVPVAYEHYKNNPENKQFFTMVNQIITVVMLIIAVGLISGKDIIILLLGEQYRSAVFVFPFLVFMPIMYTISETTVMGINFLKQSKLHIYVAVLSAITNIVGNCLLVPQLGAKGAAISTGLAYIVFFSVRTYFSTKLYKVNYHTVKFIIATTLVYGLAIYSSFNSFNFIILGSSVIIIVIIVLLYRNVFKMSLNFIRTFLIQNKK